MIYEQTSNGTNKLFLYRKEMPENQNQLGILFSGLDMYCVSGSVDMSNKDYIIWEFDSCITEKLIRQALTRAGCTLF